MNLTEKDILNNLELACQEIKNGHYEQAKELLEQLIANDCCNLQPRLLLNYLLSQIKSKQ